MIDLPENDIRDRHKPSWLVRTVNIVNEKSNETLINNTDKHRVKKAITKSANITSNIDKNENESVHSNDDLVNYKVGRLVMSILREFKVSNLLQRFEKVLVQNAKLSDLDVEDTHSPTLDNSIALSNHKIKSSQKANSDYANPHGKVLLFSNVLLKHK